MSSAGTLLTTWDEFLQIPDAPDPEHYELHDGEIVLVPPPRPIYFLIRMWLNHWLMAAAAGRGYSAQEFPCRPAANLQFWTADVAYAPEADWVRFRNANYTVFAPPLIIEVLSPSNKLEKIKRQQIAAFSGGTREFWLIDADLKTIEVSIPGQAPHTYGIGDTIEITVLPGVSLAVQDLFDALCNPEVERRFDT
jgi:Uma2 family endonuclease